MILCEFSLVHNRLSVNFDTWYLSSLLTFTADPNSSVCSVVDLRTGGRWFDPQLCQYSFRGLIVIVTGFVPFSLVSTMVM